MTTVLFNQMVPQSCGVFVVCGRQSRRLLLRCAAVVDSNGCQETIRPSSPPGKPHVVKNLQVGQCCPYFSRSSKTWLQGHSVMVGMVTKQFRSERRGELLSAHLNTNERARLSKRGRIVARNPKGLGQINPQSVSHLYNNLLDRLTAVATAIGGHWRRVPATDAITVMRGGERVR